MPKKNSNSAKTKYWQRFLIALTSFLVIYLFLNQFLDLNLPWKEPTTLKSQNGVLNVTLKATQTPVLIGGKIEKSTVWNGKYISDTWEVKGGDKIKVHFINDMDQPTNLHFHGGHISPKGNSDNVLLTINPGETFDYEYNLPKSHPPGLYWYHPHLHHYTDNQVMGGMVGAIKVLGNVDELPGIKGIPERTLVLTTQDIGDNTGRLVNNEKNPTLYIRPFETVRLRILNGSSDDFYNLSIPGPKLNIISRDGNTLSKVVSVDSEVLAPGDRIEILFQAPLWGTFDVKSLKYNAGSFTYPEDTFMKIQVLGLPVIPRALPTTLLSHEDFRDVPVVRTRTLTFSEGGTNNNPTFLIDGKEFDPNEISQIMTLGTTEQWDLINLSGDTHPFHIHINPFQVLSINGKEVNRYGYDDTFPVPANGRVTIKTKYTDFDGKYVLHCHILFHEDHGMMQVVEVVKPGASTSPNNGFPKKERMLELHQMMQNKKMPTQDMHMSH